ncbi:DUF2829 domain-containing protein [Polymorphobacter arshaanensis]|uniref:DUF2829 domain-containing protein n=1 Tax=Glacieibacterium arshaanense TaxID=2511025 RepID=A0A4Y9ESJ9_9SPHN|nr:DUF2829 domain-containing protein [Polymorphobacter arshaanensis]
MTSTNTPNFGFGQALLWLQSGRPVTRTGWNGKGMWLELQTPDLYSKMTKPYVYLCTPNGSLEHRVPWAPSQTDLLERDWMLADLMWSDSVECVEVYSLPSPTAVGAQLDCQF